MDTVAEDFENFEEIFSEEAPAQQKQNVVIEETAEQVKIEDLKNEQEEDTKYDSSYDEEEFIGFAPPAAPKQQAAKSETTEKKATESQQVATEG